MTDTGPTYYEYQKHKIRSQREELNTEREKQYIQIEKLNDKEIMYDKRKKYMIGLLEEHFRLPRDLNYEFDVDFLLDSLNPLMDRMTPNQNRNFTLIKTQNNEMKKIQSLLKDKSLIEMRIRNIDEQLEQLENDERLLEIKNGLPDDFPVDIINHVLSGLTKKKGSRRNKRKKKKSRKKRKKQ